MNLVLAVQNADVLRGLQAASPDSIAAFAADLGRDSSNLGKSLASLRTAGFVDPFALRLTAAGQDLVPRLDVLESRADAHGVRMPGDVLYVPHGELRPNPLNPRKVFDAEDIADLADTIVETGGLLQNLVVQPTGEDGYRLISDGERRWRAIGLLIQERRWLLGRLIPCLEREANPAEVRLIALIANGQREPLTELEEGDALSDYAADTGISARELARRIGRKERLVQQRIKVSREVTPGWRNRFEEGACTWEELRRSVEEARPPAPSPPPVETVERLGGDPKPSAPTPQPSPATPAALTSLDQLAVRERLILVECADKVLRAHAENGGSYQAPVGSYWLDGRLQPLVAEHRLIAFEQVRALGSAVSSWHVRLTPTAWELIDATIGAGAEKVPDDVLEAERARGGQAGWPTPDRYVTEWLNTAAKPEPAPLPKVEPDHLGDAVSAFLAAGPFEQGAGAFCKLLQACGVLGALTLDESEGAEGYASSIVDEHGGLVAITDPDEGLHPRQARALARLIAFAVNRAAGVSTAAAEPLPNSSKEPA